MWSRMTGQKYDKMVVMKTRTWSSSLVPPNPLARLRQNGVETVGNGALYQGSPQAAQAEAVAALRRPMEMLHDNEIVIMMLRPSLWYVPAVSARLTLIILLAAFLIDRTGAAARVFDAQSLWSVTGLLVAVRWAYAMINWISQLYLLTNHRIVTIRGAVKVDIFQMPLCRITEARLLNTPPQRWLNVGDLGFATGGDILPQGQWVWVSNPERVRQQIMAARGKR